MKFLKYSCIRGLHVVTLARPLNFHKGSNTFRALEVVIFQLGLNCKLIGFESYFFYSRAFLVYIYWLFRVMNGADQKAILFSNYVNTGRYSILTYNYVIRGLE